MGEDLLHFLGNPTTLVRRCCRHISVNVFMTQPQAFLYTLYTQQCLIRLATET